MKRIKLLLLGIGFPLIIFAAAVCVFGQDDNLNQRLAKRVVKSADVKPGDVVIITGGRHMIPLMEDVAIEVQMAGAFSNMWLSSDRVTRAVFIDEPEQFLGQKNTYTEDWLKKANVLIRLPREEDSAKLYADVPQARLAKFQAASDNSADAINSLPVRVVRIILPSPSDAALAGTDLATLRNMYLSAINADYEQMFQKGTKLRSLLAAGKQVRITDPSGTDFSFSLAPQRLIVVERGIVSQENVQSKFFFDRRASLPAGMVSFAPVETSGTGRLVIAKDWCGDLQIKDSKVEFKNGKLANYSAATNGKCFNEWLRANSGPADMLGSVSIGLNPEMKIMSDGERNFFPDKAEGLVYINIGDNSPYGGTNHVPTGNGWGWAIPNATVTVDGKVIVKDGKLVL